MKKALILGGGIAGLENAIQLRKYGFEVTLISNRDYIFIYPISIWIPTGEYNYDDVTISMEKLSKIHGFSFVKDEVTSISVKDKKVTCVNNTFEYEHLIIAMGGTKPKPEGIEYTMSICGTPEESIIIKENLDSLIKKGKGKIAIGFGGNPNDKSSVRGGPAFELIFNIHNHLKKKKIRDNFEISFFAPMEKPGIKMGEKAYNSLNPMLDKINIKKYTGKKIKKFTEQGVILQDDSLIESDLTLFIPAGRGHKVFQNSDLPLNDSGFIKINEHCAIDNGDATISPKNNVYAIGDSAAIDGPEWKAKQGHLAEIMADITAYNINQIEKGSDKRKEYISKINIICLMDTGNAGVFVKRDSKSAKMIPLPIIGHLMKKLWGFYYKNSKLKRIPKII